MSDLMQQFNETKDVPAIVRFERVASENKAESLRQGKWIGVDIDYVYITPPYSKDEVTKKAAAWLAQNDMLVSQGRMESLRRDRYKAEYEAWKQGQELPVEGTPIKGWGMLSPAQQELLISIKIYTVEVLAKANDEGMKRIGMGAVDMKHKAIAWIAQNTEKGPLTIEMAAIKSANRAMTIELDTMRKQQEEFKALLRAQGLTGAVVAPAPAVPHQVLVVASEEMLDDSPLPQPTPLTNPAATLKRTRRTKAEMEAVRAGTSHVTDANRQPEFQEI